MILSCLLYGHFVTCLSVVRSFHDLVMWSLGSTSRVIVFSARILTKICIHLSGEEQGDVLTLFGCYSSLKLFPSEDESLLIPKRDAFFVLNLPLHFFDTVAWSSLKSDGLSSLGLHEELHDASKLVFFFSRNKRHKLSLFKDRKRMASKEKRAIQRSSWRSVVVFFASPFYCFSPLCLPCTTHFFDR